MHSRRSGFTIIELLVVVTIIAVLMSITIRIVGAFLTQARDASTKTTLNKVQGLANQRGQNLNRLMMRKGAITTTDPTQKVLASKIVQVRYFPQRVNEISYQDQPAIYRTYSGVFGGPPPAGQNLPINPATLLADLSKYDPTLDPGRV